MFLTTLTTEFERASNPDVAAGQKAYMRDKFEFLGLKAPIRKEIQKPFLVKAYLPEKSELETIVKSLWAMPHREYQMFAQEMVFKYASKFEKLDIMLFEYMIIHKSWWDSVDFIAAKILGTYFKKFPEEIPTKVKDWLASNNIWLQRSALLFQLKYKNDLNPKLLSETIKQLLGSKEFFINKAIGWVLREYAKTNPTWVLQFVENTPELHPLSRREAIRRLN